VFGIQLKTTDFYLNNMDPETKERLYKELMQILISLEEGDFNGATMELEYLINRLKFDQL
jgi:hypothetical protein